MCFRPSIRPYIKRLGLIFHVDITSDTRYIHRLMSDVTIASFALNKILTLGKEVCCAVRITGHQLTVKYRIDHVAAPIICIGPFFEIQSELLLFLTESAAFSESQRQLKKKSPEHSTLKRTSLLLLSGSQERRVTEKVLPSMKLTWNRSPRWLWIQ